MKADQKKILKTKLAGSYVLVSFLIARDGTENNWKENYSGTLDYGTEPDTVRVEISGMNKGDPEPTPLMYEGKYELLSDCKIRHNVEKASKPDRVGVPQDRDIVFDDDNQLLTLSSEGSYGKAILTWQKK